MIFKFKLWKTHFPEMIEITTRHNFPHYGEQIWMVKIPGFWGWNTWFLFSREIESMSDIPSEGAAQTIRIWSSFILWVPHWDCFKSIQQRICFNVYNSNPVCVTRFRYHNRTVEYRTYFDCYIIWSISSVSNVFFLWKVDNWYSSGMVQ